MIEKYWVGLIFVSGLVGFAFIAYKYLSKPVGDVKYSAMDKSIDDMKANSLMEGFFTGIFCKDEAAKFLETQNTHSFKKAYTEQLVVLDIEEQKIEDLTALLLNQKYLPGIEAGFKSRGFMEGEKELENLDFADGDTVIATVAIIEEWIDESKADWNNPQRIVENLPTYFVEKLFETV
jgi:hypothetical protein